MSDLDFDSNGNQTNEEETENEDDNGALDRAESTWLSHSLGQFKMSWRQPFQAQ